MSCFRSDHSRFRYLLCHATIPPPWYFRLGRTPLMHSNHMIHGESRFYTYLLPLTTLLDLNRMSDPSNVVATRNGSVQQDEINLINKELLKLKEETKASPQFLKKRVALLRRLNSVQASTKTLPPEILFLIIQHVYHYTPVRHLLPAIILKLGHVSSYWRQIVWSTPQLWSDLAVFVRYSNIYITVPLLQLFLRNVGSLPISVALDFHWSPLPAKALDPIASVLFHETNATKIGSLRLHRAPWEWATRLHTNNFSSLKRLHFETSGRRSQALNVLDLASAPCLHDVVMGGPIPTEVKLCWSKITSLQLQGMHIDICVKLLISCPNLTNFRCTYPKNPASNTSTSFDYQFHDTITLNHLERFKWTHHRDPCCLPLFRRLRLPALKYLSWDSAWNGQREENLAICTLIPNLRTTFSSLFLCRLTWTTPFFKDVFKQTGHVESLHIGYCSEAIVVDVFSILAHDVDADDSPMLLPALKELVIWDILYGGTVEGEEKADVLSLPILRFLRNRFRKGCLEFCLGFQYSSLDLSLQVQEELCQLRREGFNLEMYNKSEKPDWLEDAWWE